MSKGWTKERVLFFVAAALFLLVMIKLGLVLSHRPPAPGAPPTSPLAPHQGDASLDGTLAPGDLASLQQRGHRRLVAPPPKMPRLPERQPEPKADDREKKKPEEDGQERRKETPGDDKDAGKKGKAGDQGQGKLAGNGKGSKAGGERADPPTRHPYRLAAIVRIEGGLQAVLRHETTGEYHRLFLGDEVNGLRLEEIWDDGVILRDLAGRRHAYGDRFAATQGR